jgi:hypothetical protein
LGSPLADHGWPATRLYVDGGKLSLGAPKCRIHRCDGLVRRMGLLYPTPGGPPSEAIKAEKLSPACVGNEFSPSFWASG